MLRFKLTDVEGKYNTRIKHFPHEQRITCFSQPIFNPLGVEEVKVGNQTNILSGAIENTKEIAARVKRIDNIKRAKDNVYEIAYATKFSHFVTLTLDEKLINRTDKEAITKALNSWLRNHVQRNRLAYILIPEYHKDGESIHFHGLICGNLKLIDSGHKTAKGQIIYNIGNWKYGFSTAIALDENYDRIVNYILKYITKDNEKVLGRYYLSGGELSRKVPTDYCNLDYITFDGKEYEILAAKMAVKYKTLPMNVDVVCDTGEADNEESDVLGVGSG